MEVITLVHVRGRVWERFQRKTAVSFLRAGGGDLEKFAGAYPSTGIGSYSLQDEDLSKTEIGVGRLSLGSSQGGDSLKLFEVE